MPSGWFSKRPRATSFLSRNVYSQASALCTLVLFFDAAIYKNRAWAQFLQKFHLLKRCAKRKSLRISKAVSGAFTRGSGLADLKVPEKILFLEKLPKGISGKIQRAALKQLQLEAV